MTREAVDCESYREQIALHVEGDLDAAEARRLERHLEACASCRAWADAMAASQQALRRQLEPPLDEVVLARVRAGVRAEIGRRRARPVRWLALAASLLAALVLWRYREPRPAAPPEAPPARTAEAVKAAPEVPEVPEVPATVAETPPVPPPPDEEPSPPPPTTIARGERKPLLIKLTSSDQKLVIYWLVDPTEKKEKEHETATVL